jgi:hypothetical protein
MVWGRWHYFSGWAGKDAVPVESWRHTDTLKFQYDQDEFRHTLLLNTGGDEHLANRLHQLLEKRVLRHCQALQVAQCITGRVRLARVEVSVWPTDRPEDCPGDRKRAMLSLRWLIRWQLEQRRQFDPKLRAQM